MLNLPRWTVAAPLLGLLALMADASGSVWIGSIVALVLIGAVLAAVYHAEIIAHYRANRSERCCWRLP